MKHIQTAEDKFNQMTQTPVSRLVFSLAIPTIVSMMITSIYNITDTFFVSRIGTSASGAVGVSFALMSILQAIGFTLGVGSGNYISRLLGEKNIKQASVVAATAFYTALIIGLFFAISVFVFINPLVRILGATETIAPYAKSYIQFILIGMPYMAASFVLNLQMRFQGCAFYSMIGIGAGSIINIMLDPLFIFVFGLGTSGAAIATIISQFISFCVLYYNMATRGDIVKISFKNFTMKFKIYKEILRGGLPSFYRQSLSSISMIFLNYSAGPYGDQAIAAMSIVMRTLQLASSVILGLGQGFQPVCGYNYGAEKYDRVIGAFWFTLKISVIITIIFSTMGFIFSSQIMSVFRKDDIEVIKIGILAIRFQCLTFPLVPWVIMVNMLLQTIGRGLHASIISISRQGMFFLPSILILPNFLGLLGVQMSQPISDFLSFILSIPFGFTILKELKYKQIKVSKF